MHLFSTDAIVFSKKNLELWDQTFVLLSVE